MKTPKSAVPTAAGALCQHFGHCEQFALSDVDGESRRYNDIHRRRSGIEND